jgi:hypothetical protein
VVGRGELTDKAWARIEPLLPPIESGGRVARPPPSDQRNPVEAAHRGPVARSARALWALEDRARTAAYLDQGRHVRAAAAARWPLDGEAAVESAGELAAAAFAIGYRAPIRP